MQYPNSSAKYYWMSKWLKLPNFAKLIFYKPLRFSDLKNVVQLEFLFHTAEAHFTGLNSRIEWTFHPDWNWLFGKLPGSHTIIHRIDWARSVCGYWYHLTVFFTPNVLKSGLKTVRGHCWSVTMSKLEIMSTRAARELLVPASNHLNYHHGAKFRIELYAFNLYQLMIGINVNK